MILLEVCNADLQLKQKPKVGCVVVQSVPLSCRQCPPHGEELFPTLCFALQSAAQCGCTGDCGHCNAKNYFSKWAVLECLLQVCTAVFACFTPFLMCLECPWVESCSAQLTREMRHTQKLQNGLAEAGSRIEQYYRAWS